MNKRTFVIVDLANLFQRARHGVRGSLDDKVGLSMHTVLTSIRKAWTDFSADHVVICLEGRSWRRSVYAPYKNNRDVKKAALTPTEAEQEKVFWETFDDFKTFVTERTNCTVLQNSLLEADDLIAGWVQRHPHDDHVVISTDTDFVQLIAPNVKQYNGVTGVTITHEGYFDLDGNPVINSKTGLAKTAPDPEYEIFLKCVRGDSSDNVFSAYPGAREKGTKNRVGIIDAYNDRKNRGYDWNNFFMQTWTDHEGVLHTVNEDFQRNVLLCNLTAQPEHIREEMFDTIDQAIASNKEIQQVGVKLLKFCSTYSLQRISESVTSYAAPLNARYNI